MKTKSTLLFLAIALCANVTAVNAQVNVQDSLALVDLYNSTDGPHWNGHAGWLTKGAPVKSWSGITVGDSRVTSIYLFDNNLTGTLPSSLGDLTNVFSIDLGYNSLSGSIPSSIGNFV